MRVDSDSFDWKKIGKKTYSIIGKNMEEESWGGRSKWKEGKTREK